MHSQLDQWPPCCASQSDDPHNFEREKISCCPITFAGTPQQKSLAEDYKIVGSPYLSKAGVQISNIGEISDRLRAVSEPISNMGEISDKLWQATELSFF